MHAEGLGPRAPGRGVLALVALVAVACGGKKEEAPAADQAPATARVRTARVLDEAALTALSAVTMRGHEIEVVARGPDFGAVVHVGDVAATVTISACVTCTPIEAARWEAERPALTAMLAPAPGDVLALERIERGGWPLIVARARRTIEGVEQAVALALWNDGATQLIVSCERAGGAAAEDLCVLLVEACALSYLPALAP